MLKVQNSGLTLAKIISACVAVTDGIEKEAAIGETPAINTEPDEAVTLGTEKDPMIGLTWAVVVK